MLLQYRLYFIMFTTVLVEVDKDVYDDIKEQYDCGIDKQWDDNWEMHYYVDDAILDLYESNCLIICEQW